MVAFFKQITLAATAGSSLHSGHSYDYIVVGGGTSGAALATRLSQALKTSSILLIEAGPAAPDELKINAPGMMGSTVGGPYDWNLTTTPQPSLDGRQVALSRGKVLGGSSAMNYMLMNRAAAPEYDVWETLGNPGWNWDGFLAGMVKSENFSGVDGDDYGHAGAGTAGPLHTVIDRFRTPQVKAWVPTLENLGLSHNLESLGGNPLGAMLQPSSIFSDNYTRSYSANAYLPHAGPNLAVALSTRVARVSLEKASKSRSGRSNSKNSMVATGVTLQDGTVVTARKEVILSAGSLQSPGLLEMSGIGRKDVLDAAGVEQIIELPGVGENLQDHVGLGVTYQLKPGYNSLDILKYNATYRAEQMRLWENNEVSRFDYAFDSIAFLNWKQLVGDDTSLVHLARQAFGNSTNVIDQTKLSFLSDYSIPQMEMAMADTTIGPYYPTKDDPAYGSDFVSLLGIVMRPLSRGSIHIRTSNIADSPVIDPQYASNAYDFQGLIEAGKFSRRIAQTEPLASMLAREHVPGLAAVTTDDEWAEYAKKAMITIFHQAGTCAMLPRDQGGVVDAQLRVWGTENLRVVDMSIIPVLMGSHPQTAAYGVAEKAADIIIEEHKGREAMDSFPSEL